MFRTPPGRRRALAAGIGVVAAAAGAAGVAIGSDHRDTPFTEMNPKSDMTDVYAFPGSAPGRIALVMDTRAFLTPAEAMNPDDASFDTNALYQFKVDNTGDAKGKPRHPGDVHRIRRVTAGAGARTGGAASPGADR